MKNRNKIIMTLGLLGTFYWLLDDAPNPAYSENIFYLFMILLVAVFFLKREPVVLNAKFISDINIKTQDNMIFKANDTQQSLKGSFIRIASILLIGPLISFTTYLLKLFFPNLDTEMYVFLSILICIPLLMYVFKRSKKFNLLLDKEILKFKDREVILTKAGISIAPHLLLRNSKPEGLLGPSAMKKKITQFDYINFSWNELDKIQVEKTFYRNSIWKRYMYFYRIILTNGSEELIDRRFFYPREREFLNYVSQMSHIDIILYNDTLNTMPFF